jgi:hypothetical protein
MKNGCTAISSKAVIDLAQSKPISETSLASYKYPPIRSQNLVRLISILAKWITAQVYFAYYSPASSQKYVAILSIFVLSLRLMIV